jgi:hypothetical protein
VPDLFLLDLQPSDQGPPGREPLLFPVVVGVLHDLLVQSAQIAHREHGDGDQLRVLFAQNLLLFLSALGLLALLLLLAVQLKARVELAYTSPMAWRYTGFTVECFLQKDLKVVVLDFLISANRPIRMAHVMW